MADTRQILRRLDHLRLDIEWAGATTAELLDELDDDTPAHLLINEMDSRLSIWEDEIEALRKEIENG